MKTTHNYGLKKPEPNEFYSVDVQNDNMDAIDSQMKQTQDDKEIFVHGHSLSRDIRDVTSVNMMVYLRREKWKDRSRQLVHIRTD